MDIEQKALQFATEAHGNINHLRKYTGEPYIVHPMAVADLVRSVKHTPAMIAAAYLHDVVEDTPVTMDQIYDVFGQDVGDLVYFLTDISKPLDGNREVRKAMDRAHIAAAPPEAKTIKLADLIDNTKTIELHDPDFWKVYRREKMLLLEVLGDGDVALWNTAARQINVLFYGGASA